VSVRVCSVSLGIRSMHAKTQRTALDQLKSTGHICLNLDYWMRAIITAGMSPLRLCKRNSQNLSSLNTVDPSGVSAPALFESAVKI
jgi:hypothetical protein